MPKTPKIKQSTPANPATPASFISGGGASSGKGQRPNTFAFNPNLSRTTARTGAPSLLGGV